MWGNGAGMWGPMGQRYEMLWGRDVGQRCVGPWGATGWGHEMLWGRDVGGLGCHGAEMWGTDVGLGRMLGRDMRCYGARI